MTIRNKHDFLFLVMLTLMYTTVCMETDIYVPSFPDMKLFFATTADAIQRTLSVNFVGLCLGSLIFGPLSDSFGRKSMLLIGLSIFTLTSWACLLFTNFDFFLISRFFQGMGAAAPMVITFAMLLEKYEPEKVAQLCSGINLFITGMMAVAPVLGSFLNLYYGWHANFIVIACLATITFFGGIFITETLPRDKRSAFSIPKVMKNYATVITSFPFVGSAFVCYLLFAALTVFISNLSLIFIDFLGVSKESYGFYQASAPASFALFSFISIWIIEYFGTVKTKYAGLVIAAVGALLLLIVSTAHPQPLLICISMVIFTAGTTLSATIYGTESANIYPEMRGVATGMSNALRYLIIAGVVGIGSYSFNGTINPVTNIIALSTTIAILLALGLAKKKTSLLNPAVSN